jgi:hypothetical protein
VPDAPSFAPRPSGSGFRRFRVLHGTTSYAAVPAEFGKTVAGWNSLQLSRFRIRSTPMRRETPVSATSLEEMY